ncbi:MAG: TetR/AcrR family transcriptional regulator [Burkholderiales bacterium]|nr:MAG: TetR/AcrR family transcriptional regulator [Burkholderiales bacterium]
MRHTNTRARKSRPAPASGQQRSAAAAQPRHGYHHGELRAALIAATEAILAERGVDGFTLREAARRAGVSPAAPSHHFGDAAGLLTAVAKLGFDGLAEALRAGATAAGREPLARLRGLGIGYVRFALANRARFLLMFRRAVLRPDDPMLAAANAAYRELEDAIRVLRGCAPDEGLDERGHASLIAYWSVVHGFAHLALDGQFERAATDGLEAFVARVLPPVLEQLRAPEPAAGGTGAPAQR